MGLCRRGLGVEDDEVSVCQHGEDQGAVVINRYVDDIVGGLCSSYALAEYKRLHGRHAVDAHCSVPCVSDLLRDSVHRTH